MASDDDIRAFKGLIEQARTIVSDDRALANAIRQFPGLAWVKRWEPDSNRYIMTELSDQYVLRILGGKREDYIGKTDFDVWDFETALAFFENDEDTRNGRRNPTQDVSEPWESSRTGQKGTFNGKKWRFDSDGITYVAGMG